MRVQFASNLTYTGRVDRHVNKLVNRCIRKNLCKAVLNRLKGGNISDSKIYKMIYEYGRTLKGELAEYMSKVHDDIFVTIVKKDQEKYLALKSKGSDKNFYIKEDAINHISDNPENCLGCISKQDDADTVLENILFFNDALRSISPERLLCKLKSLANK